MPLHASAESLIQMATHLVLHATESASSGSLLLRLDSVDLGGRIWGVLEAVPQGAAAMPPHLLGMGWLQAEIVEARGMLELEQRPETGLVPRIYLPAADPGPCAVCSLEGKRIWVVEGDPLLRDTLTALVRQWGGDAEGFEDLPALLRGSRTGRLPNALVLERTPQLDRFQKALRTFQREPIPTLVMGTGQLLPVSPAQLGLRRLGFMEKPFPSGEFAQALLALLLPHGNSRMGSAV
jgi:hypothetical protein